ncbi:MAG: hypothetical protein WCJ88_12205 [Actinomycetes bacterium]
MKGPLLDIDVENYLTFVGVRPGPNNVTVRLDGTRFAGNATFTLAVPGLTVSETEEPLARIDPEIIESREDPDGTVSLSVQLTNLGSTTLTGIVVSVHDPSDRSILASTTIATVDRVQRVDLVGIPSDRLGDTLVLSAIGNETVANGNRQIALKQALVKDGGSYWATVLLGIAAAVAVGAVVYSSVEWFNSRDRTKSGENI